MLRSSLSLPDPVLRHCRDLARQYDAHRFVVSLYLPEWLRNAYWVLIAFNVEVSRTADTVSDPVTGAIRLKWWEEAVEQAISGKHIRQQPVCEALAGLAQISDLTPLKQSIHAREADLQSGCVFKTLTELDDYAQSTAGNLLLPLSEIPEEQQMLSELGMHWALIGSLRAHLHHLRHQRCLVPADVIAAHGQQPDSIFECESLDFWPHIIEILAQRSTAYLANGTVDGELSRFLRLHKTVLKYYAQNLSTAPLHSLMAPSVRPPLRLQLRLWRNSH